MYRAALNGFGRFGFGLFRAWFNDPNSNYEISYINDSVLSANQIRDILLYDLFICDFHSSDIRVSENTLRISRPNGRTAEIQVSQGALILAPWRGVPEVIFECSGAKENHDSCGSMIIGRTKNVVVGATVPQSDATLIMGHNNTDFNPISHKVVSFGSCTAIPGVHVISLIKESFPLIATTVNIVHSVPKWQLEMGRWKSLARKACSLEAVAPALISGLESPSLKVNYTFAPYHGVSLMDFDFFVAETVSSRDVCSVLRLASRSPKRMGILATSDLDAGGEEWENSEASIALILKSIDVRDRRIFFHGYFNNEGSGIRLHELYSFMIKENEIASIYM